MFNETTLFKAFSYDRTMVFLLKQFCDGSYALDCTVNNNHTAYKFTDLHIAKLAWQQKIKDCERYSKFVIVPPVGQMG